jgi:hypothetical protein
MANSRDLAEYVAGLIDGEGCFSLTFRQDVRHERPGSPVYYSWKVMFAIELRKDDYKLLQTVKRILDCGSMTYSQKGTVRYQVANLDDLNVKIVSFFERYPLLGKKGLDFGYWKEAVKILYSRKYKLVDKIIQGDTRLKEIHTAMRPYKGTYANKPLRVPEVLPNRKPL